MKVTNLRIRKKDQQEKQTCKSLKRSKEKKANKIKQKSMVFVNNPQKVSKKKKTKRLNYTSDDMDHALKAIDSGVSLRKAAAAFGVPAATLGRKKNNPDAIKRKTGPETVLSKNEEDDIVNWVLYRAERGMPVTKTELLDSVQKFVTLLQKKTPFKENRPSRHWYEGFRKRHPQLTMRKPQHLSLNRATVSKEDLQEWFSDQKKYLKEKNLLEISSTRVFNCDETNIILCPDSEKVLIEVGSRSVYTITDAGKESLTVLFMYAANGVRAPPMLMYAYKGDVPKKIVENTPKSWGIGISENGWMTTETFYEYITNVFYPWLISEKVEFPVVIFLDNHSSHINIPLVRFCRDKKIELIGLFPNSTHIMQPLDISFFHPFKQAWKKAVPKWKNQQNVMRLKKEDFPIVLKFTLDNMEEKKAVISGFKASGLWPFNPHAVDYDVLKKRKKRKESLDQQEDSRDLTETERRKFLQNFENNLSAELLLEFKNALSKGSWTGDIEKKALFEYYVQINQISTGNISKTKPTVKNIEILHTHKVRLVSQETDKENIRINQLLSTNESTANDTTPKSDLIQPIYFFEPEASPDLINESVIEDDYKIVSEVLYVPDNEKDLLELVCDTSTGDTSTIIPLDVDSIDFPSQKNQSILQQFGTSLENNQIERKDIIQIKPESIGMISSSRNNNTESNNNRSMVDNILPDDLSHKKENISVNTNQAVDFSLADDFSEAFTLPLKYLPSKKRSKVEALGKSKLPSAVTSDKWFNHHLQKEKLQEIKKEKIKKKKELQEQKKKLAKEKKELQEKMKEIQKKIKQEIQ
ncbi:uncharacterized protein LOC105833505 [Monomorium pharaonis]|uniref:uncharacterized protein LOC105833505 n=1 Tax=Monomorium pharaonis TaxID=307658 RepID=UPI001746463C|nr:uncharacterized protein LOC105833505 [Monomorium pharaonis]